MAYCIRCGGEVQPGKSYCHHCGALANHPAGIDPIAQPTQKGGGFRKILKWGGIGCGGFTGVQEPENTALVLAESSALDGAKQASDYRV